ncbi:type II toxin-antitoxin system death-on-curing family toxin [Streptomyces sp. UH6]|uniref:type II toxin-antitoxin system death-on-curing family toxin n=1 Tax=Streptomyces sp. UH6 TaxID=2748379 RepID=UPI0015D4C964|nr:type II toxin-antitoxin system death-on-curing family toxin [Streptomyces sp. UH6]NYV77804.1 type II toxin-antitoxin system death-on-curing family toxin [Streptomyces sp. UH6]
MRHLTVEDVLALAALGCGGQEIAVRDDNLLASAVQRPRSRMFGTEAYPGLWEKAAALLHGLARNHPLVDGNKRQAWMATAVFLHLNGAPMLHADQDAAYTLVVAVASGEVADVEVIASRLRELAGAV